jgi:hypothetical protein
MNVGTQFNTLPLAEKAVITWGGEYINSVKFSSGCVMLYLVENKYFVEVFYNSEKKKIIGISAAEQDRLFLYMEELDIEQLVN